MANTSVQQWSYMRMATVSLLGMEVEQTKLHSMKLTVQQVDTAIMYEFTAHLAGLRSTRAQR